jgi:branched-chain amino acid aminotransferase
MTTMITPYEIKTEKVTRSRLPGTNLENIVFGRVFTDHMLVSDFHEGQWQDTKIMPFQNLSLSPATTALHYGQEIFEGLKAYKDQEGKAYLFRPYENLKRMNHSAERMVMPQIPEEIFVEGIRALIELDRDWIPTKEGSSLYIRPFMFATDEYVGIKASDNYKFVTFSCPVNAYYPEPIKIKVEQHYVRAAQGGTGEAKTAGNYAASLYAVSKASKQGYRQMLWTDSQEHKWIEESGTMNVFFVIGDKIITPNLNGSILHGITRDSILTLLRDNEYKVEERPISVDEVIDAYRAGELKEVFGTGTAATIAFVEAIGYKDEELKLSGKWEVADWLLETLKKIKTGILPDKFGWMVKI